MSAPIERPAATGQWLPEPSAHGAVLAAALLGSVPGTTDQVLPPLGDL